MPNLPTVLNPDGAAAPVDCPTCTGIERRDSKVIDALQDAMSALTTVDGFDLWQLRSARAKASILEAMRLMQARSW